MAKNKYVRKNTNISLDDAIAYDLKLVGQRGKVHAAWIVLALILFFPLAILLCVVNCVSKDPIYLLTVHKQDHYVMKNVIGELRKDITLETLKSAGIEKVQVL